MHFKGGFGPNFSASQSQAAANSQTFNQGSGYGGFGGSAANAGKLQY